MLKFTPSERKLKMKFEHLDRDIMELSHNIEATLKNWKDKNNEYLETDGCIGNRFIKKVGIKQYDDWVELAYLHKKLQDYATKVIEC